MLAMDVVDCPPDDASEPALVRVVEPCRERCGACDPCLEAVAGLHMNRLLYARWLVQTTGCADPPTHYVKVGGSRILKPATARLTPVPGLPGSAVRQDG